MLIPIWRACSYRTYPQEVNQRAFRAQSAKCREAVAQRRRYICACKAIAGSNGLFTKKRNGAKSVPTWQGQKDLNPRHMVLETIALPTELYPYRILLLRYSYIIPACAALVKIKLHISSQKLLPYTEPEKIFYPGNKSRQAPI